MYRPYIPWECPCGIAIFAESGLNVGLGIIGAYDSLILTACRQRSRASCADGAQSGFECCFQDFDIRLNTEKLSAGMFFVLSSLGFRGRDVQPRALRHVQILRENVQRPRGWLGCCKNPERWQHHAPLRGGARRLSRKSCAKSGDGFLPRDCRDQTRFQFGFPAVCFSLPSFLDFGV